MDALGLVPDAVEVPADLTFRQRRVARAVDLLGLVVAEEALQNSGAALPFPASAEAVTRNHLASSAASTPPCAGATCGQP